MLLRAKVLSSIFGSSTAFFSLAFLQDSTNLTFAPSLTYGLLAGLATGAMSYGILRGRVETLRESNKETKEHLLRIDTTLSNVAISIEQIKGILGSRRSEGI